MEIIRHLGAVLARHTSPRAVLWRTLTQTSMGNASGRVRYAFVLQAVLLVLMHIVLHHCVNVGRVAQSVDRLWAGRSGDRIPMWAAFFAHVQKGPGPSQPPVQCVPGLYRG
jgi:hypothetical protein